jgi:hypothetical protein
MRKEELVGKLLGRTANQSLWIRDRGIDSPFGFTCR